MWMSDDVLEGESALHSRPLLDMVWERLFDPGQYKKTMAEPDP